jgi:hypothetical protein
LTNRVSVAAVSRSSNAPTGLNPEPMDWLWMEWLAAGKTHLLGGQPGAGRSRQMKF